MSERDELNALRALKAARDAGNRRAELKATRQLRQTGQPAEPLAAARPGFGEVFAQTAATRAADNFLNIPAGAGNLLAGGAAAANTAAGTVPRLFGDQPLNIGDRFSTNFAKQKKLFPASALRAIPTPSANQVVAGAKTGVGAVRGLLGGEPLNIRSTFAGELDAIQQRGAELATQRPIATGLGNVAGDVATLLTGRAPFVRAATRRPQIPKLDAGSKRLADQIMNLKSIQLLRRGVGRAAETGIEGAALAAIQDGNPAEAGAYNAGLQLAGSATLQATKGIFRHPGRVALAAIVAHQVAKSIVPGGKNFILETIEESFDEISLGLVAGIVAGAAGLGRLRGTKVSELFPQAADALATIPRAAVVSLVNDILADEDNGSDNTLRVLTQYIENPEFFGDDLARIDRAITSDDVSLAETVNKLIDEGRGFAEKIDAAGTAVAAAITQDSLRSALSADNKGVQFLKPSDIAKRAARILGTDRVKRFGFDRTDTGPKAFITNALKDDGAIDTMKKRLSKSAFNDVLVTNLDNLISASTKVVRDRPVIDGTALRQRWEQLPESARALYDDTQRQAIEAFIDATSEQSLSGLPPMVAQALMQGGELVEKLIGKPKPETRASVIGTNF